VRPWCFRSQLSAPFFAGVSLAANFHLVFPSFATENFYVRCSENENKNNLTPLNFCGAKSFAIAANMVIKYHKLCIAASIWSNPCKFLKDTGALEPSFVEDTSLVKRTLVHRSAGAPIFIFEQIKSKTEIVPFMHDKVHHNCIAYRCGGLLRGRTGGSTGVRKQMRGG
jgi:hypothetical protein